jgi:hypothetical protein
MAFRGILVSLQAHVGHRICRTGKYSISFIRLLGYAGPSNMTLHTQEICEAHEELEVLGYAMDILKIILKIILNVITRSPWCCTLSLKIINCDQVQLCPSVSA